jgi:RNA polymerase sigma factor (sigma-70 family)
MDEATQALERQYSETAPKLLAYFRGQPGVAAAADDLVQETFLRAWRQRKHLQAAVSPRAYLFGIARHLTIDALRQRRPAAVSPPVTADALPPWHAPEAAPSLAWRSELLRLAASLLLGGIAGGTAQSLRVSGDSGRPPAVAPSGTRATKSAESQPAFWSVAHLIRETTAPQLGDQTETQRLRWTLPQRIPQPQEKP